MNELKVIQQTQRDYFDLLHSHFKAEQADFRSRKIDTFDSLVNFMTEVFDAPLRGGLLVRDQRMGQVPAIFTRIRDLLLDVDTFWRQRTEGFFKAIRDEKEIYCSAIDDLQWFHRMDTVRCYGLYFDSVLIPARLSYYAFQFGSGLYQWETPQAVIAFGADVLRDFLLLLQRERLFLADSSYPIAVVYPAHAIILAKSASGAEESEDPAFKLRTRFLNEALGLTLAGPERAIAYLRNSDFNSIFRRLKKSKFGAVADRIQADMRVVAGKTLEDRLRAAVETGRRSGGVEGKVQSPRGAETIGTWLYRSFGQLLNYQRVCDNLLADQAVADSHWELYSWMLNDEERAIDSANETSPEARAVTRAMQAEGLKWLCAVDFQDLVRLREKGHMEEMRSLFRINRKRLKTVLPDQYDAVAMEVENNLKEALQEHSHRLAQKEKVDRELRLVDAAGLVLTISFAMISGYFLSPAFGVAAAALGIPWGKSAYDLYQSRSEHTEEMEKLATRPIGVLWNAMQKANAASQS